MYRVRIGKLIIECESPREVLALQREMETPDSRPRGGLMQGMTYIKAPNGHTRKDLALLREIISCPDGIDNIALVERLALKAPRGLGGIIGKLRQKLERLGFNLDDEVMRKYVSGGGTPAWKPGDKAQEALKALEEETAE